MDLVLELYLKFVLGVVCVTFFNGLANAQMASVGFPALDFSGNLLKAVQVGLVRFDPAAFVANDVFVGQFADRLDFFHGRVLQNGLLAIGVELCVQLYFFKSVDSVVEFVSHLTHSAAATTAQLSDRLEGLLAPARLQERPNLLRFIDHSEVIVVTIELNNLNHSVLHRVRVDARPPGP